MEEFFMEEDAVDVVPQHLKGYATEIILDRAIPDVRDGLKPVQRRILYTLGEAKLKSTAKHMKQAKASGLVLAYHPHGDSSISSSMALLSQDWKQRVPLVDMNGNNGSLDGDSPAAPRYVAVRLTAASEQLLDGLGQDSVDFVPSFDGEDEEPVVLPARWPVLFTNGAEGIAYGYSCRIVPHNPVELLKGARLLNRKEGATLKDLREVIPGPDFPTGGVVTDLDGLDDLYQTGRGTFKLRGRAHIDKQQIVITEIPYGVTKTDVVSSLYTALVKAGADHQLKDLYDDSKGDGVHIVVELKRGYDPELILALLYQSSLLEVSVTGNHVAIVDQSPRELGLVDYLETFLDFRRTTLRRQFSYEWDQRVDRLRLIQGYLHLADVADQVVAMIRQSDGRADVVKKLENQFDFTPRQSNAIADMALHRMSHQDVVRLEKEAREIQDRLDDLSEIATDVDRFRQEVDKDLEETLNLLGDIPRRSVLKRDVLDTVVDQTDVMKAEKTYVVTKDRGVQRMSVLMYDNNIEKFDGDLVSAEETDTLHSVVFFSQNGLCFQRKVTDLDYLSLTQDPDDLQRQVGDFKSDDRLIGSIVFDNTDNLEVLTITRQGQFKRVPLEKHFLSFNNKGYLTRSKTYHGLKLDGDQVLKVMVDTPDALDQLVFNVTRDSGRGRPVTVYGKEITQQGPSGSGANYYKMKADECLVIESIAKGDSDAPE